MKTIIICGTKKNCLSNVFKTFLQEKGFYVGLFSRSATTTKSRSIFNLDLSKPSTFKHVLPLRDLSAVIFSQDSGTAFGDFDILNYNQIQEFLDSKIIGSILFSRFLLEKEHAPDHKKIKLIWTCGTYSIKPKNYLLYHITNAAIKSFVEELNTHYSEVVEAYYVVTPFMHKTTIGMLYNRTSKKKESGEEPKNLLPYLEKIIDNKIQPGVVMVSSNFVK